MGKGAPTMPEYIARWEIIVDADTPYDAAREAREAQTRPGTMAVVFNVSGPLDQHGNPPAGAAGDPVEIDLYDYAPSHCTRCKQPVEWYRGQWRGIDRHCLTTDREQNHIVT